MSCQHDNFMSDSLNCPICLKYPGATQTTLRPQVMPVLQGPPMPIPSGIKHDQEKPDMSLLSSIALIKIAQVMSFGKKKYSAHNWRNGFQWSRILSAAFRHLVAYIGGEDKDPETGLSHLAHLGCCVMFLLEFEDTHSELDDRYKK